MKIVFFDNPGTLGGAGMCLVDLVASLRSAQPDWELEAVLGEDGLLRKPLEALGVPVTVLPVPDSLAKLGDSGLGGKNSGSRSLSRLLMDSPAAALATYAYCGQLRKHLRAARPDVLHTNGMKAHPLGAWSAPSGVSVLWQIHGQIGNRLVLRRVVKAAWKPAFQIVAVSRFIAEDIATVLGSHTGIQTIHNAVDLERFSPGSKQDIACDVAALDAAAGLPPSTPGTLRIGLVAIFARLKGHDVFLDAAARMAHRHPCRFYLVGGPFYRTLGAEFSMEELRARADQLGIADRVAFTGYYDDPAAAIRALDIVVLSSVEPESFGRVIIEGMACGKAVITTAHGGSVELYEEGVTALGSAPGDAAALAKAMDRLASDPGLRRSLGEAGRRHVEAHFDRRRLADKWVPVYEKIAAAHG